jgi:hypothetical protein
LNLHQIVRGNIIAVNPEVPVTIRVSTGSTTNADYSSTPTYDTVTGVWAQVQDLSADDLRQVEALNLQGSHKTIYLNGSVAGIVRDASEGGDLVTLPDGSIWLITKVVEQWPDWCHAIMTLQNGS